MPSCLPTSGNPLVHTAIAILDTLSPRAQVAMIRFLDTFTTTDAERRALLIKLLVPSLPDGVVAEIAGMHRATLLRSRIYKRLKTYLRERDPRQHLPVGLFDDDGAVLDAWSLAEN